MIFKIYEADNTDNLDPAVKKLMTNGDYELTAGDIPGTSPIVWVLNRKEGSKYYISQLETR